MAKVTLQSIADRVGVSRMTVSNAFSRPDQLSADLRARILTAADELGYVGPDPAARALARGRTGAVGMVLNDRLSDAFEDAIAAEFFAAVADTLADNGLALTLLTPSRDDYVPSRDVAMDGALLYICEPDSVDLAWLDRRGLPQVAIDQHKRERVASVNVDDRGGARSAAQHLVDLGHTRIGILTLASNSGGPSPSFPADQRMLGWHDALDAAGIEPTVAMAPYRPGDRRPGGRPHPARPRRTDRRRSCASPTPSRSASIRAAESLGLSVPGDVSVVGFDDSSIAVVTRPPLTTVRQDVARKGQLAVATLLATMREQQLPDDVLLPTELVVRESTAPPAG